MSALNLVYIHSHDTGRYIQPYGAPVETPRLQAFAEQGVLFRQAHCAAPTCSPSRASLLTGMYAHETGMLGLAHRGFELHYPQRHLAHVLREYGYRTALFGMQHLTHESQLAKIGYQSAWTERSDAEIIAPMAAAWLLESPAEPFFMDVGFFETHRPFPDVAAEHGAAYTAPMPGLPDTPETRLDAAGFHRSVCTLDYGIGQVLDALDQAGLTGRTLVICTTDHGPAFPGMKCTLNSLGTGVMLIMRGPGECSGGQIIDALVSNLDVFPTICELLNIHTPEWLQGHSLMPLVRGERENIREMLFSEVTFHAAYEPQRGLRTTRWSYIRRYDGREHRVLPNIDDSPSKDVLLRHGLQSQVIAPEELHDLLFDPDERQNLATDPAYANILNEMRAFLDEWMQATNDPLLPWGLIVPDHVLVNDPDALSPDEPTRPA